MLPLQCQRWRDRCGVYVPAGEVINPTLFSVDVVPERIARPFVEQHHYSGTYPAARLAVGLFRRAELVGVTVFSEGIQRAALPRWAGVEADDGCELGRLVLLDDVEGNGESWFVSRALAALKLEKPAMRAVLSYADPVDRLDAAGRLVKPGHIGTVYQALNAVYRGRASKRTDLFAPNGERVSGRALSKIRLDETGAGYATDQLVRLGASRRLANESGRDWIARLQREHFFRPVRHPGNHTYVFGLTPGVRKKVRKLDADRLDYPKKIGGRA